MYSGKTPQVWVANNKLSTNREYSIVFFSLNYLYKQRWSSGCGERLYNVCMNVYNLVNEIHYKKFNAYIIGA